MVFLGESVLAPWLKACIRMNNPVDKLAKITRYMLSWMDYPSRQITNTSLSLDTDKHLTMQIVHLDCWSICLHVYNTDKLSDKLSCLSLNLIACFKTCQLFSLFLIIHISHSSAAQISTSFSIGCFLNLCANSTEHWTKAAFAPRKSEMTLNKNVILI